MTTTTIDFDIYDHALQDDPYPVYARLRDESPLHHNVEHDYWVLSRHEDVHWAVRSDDVLSNAMGVTLDASAWNEHAHKVMSFLAMDPPEQVRLRRLVSQGFTPRRVAALGPRIQQLTDKYLDRAHRGWDVVVRLDHRLRRPPADGRDLRTTGGAGGRPRRGTTPRRSPRTPRGRAARRSPGRRRGLPRAVHLLRRADRASGAVLPATTWSAPSCTRRTTAPG